MSTLMALSRAIDTLLERLGRIGSLALLGLIGVVIFDVVTRRFMNIGSTQLQEGEWHLHTVLIMLYLGLAYVKNVHVRIDLVRERLSERKQAWIELLGCLLLLMPFCIVVGYHATHFAWTSYIRHEVSQSVDGLPYRFAIKAMLPLGIYLLALAGISRIIVSLNTILSSAGSDTTANAGAR
ncbi:MULTISPECIES: TRAP transporter small permease subunit [Phyllobacteriaceae]|uniref:TRAP transporter small permease protein n=1 Tax=Ollibium composti TaxID=2675109 RepID=A0ABY2Q3F8_9HYPH|nr:MULTISPECIES: TRAP transporter small permease subunit [Mesorhizobium]THF55306.1 TRAP transporter small permease subunit [Mesorhizobium composti]